jgi:hypothetical protein
VLTVLMYVLVVRESVSSLDVPPWYYCSNATVGTPNPLLRAK